MYPLISVMGGLHQQEMRRYYHPQRISTEETIVLPQESISPDLETMYDAVWLQCNREYQTFTASTDRHVQEANLHALLQRYTWAMPAPDANDVSLFDYARVCAAVAVCLSASENRSEPPVLLVGGDVSGVQEWLYTFSSRGAAKSLRGRSFYLQLLSEVIAQYILDTLDLPSANLLYAGGGNFYLLAPPIVADKIPELRRDISQRMLTMHEGSLYVVIAAAEMTTDMLTGQNEQDVGMHGAPLDNSLGD
ncbi:hypothetical protein KFU94_26660 [Chloroflexi bacterium TSY]|nr:hypothetical protein [Chloroflexi bacterium TSY]